MGALRSKFETTVKPRVLIVVDQLHSFENPENDVVEYLAEFAQRRHVLNLIELLESALCLTRHCRRSDVELCETDPLDRVMDLINRRAPTQHRGSAVQFVP